MKLYNGDCLETMDMLIEQGFKVDAIITDPPYGTTACKWDSVIPFDEMWERLNKLIKPNGAIVLFGSEPFSSALRMSNIKNYKYDWIWEKNMSADFIMAKNKPMIRIENISVFSDGKYGIGCKNRMKYNPQGIKPLNKNINSTNVGGGKDQRPDRTIKKVSYIQKFTNYPINVLKINKETKHFHPTQKPIALMEYLIKTYTNGNELVLDFTMGSGSTGVACKNTNRDFIGIELDKGYYDIACNRIKDIKL